MNDANKLETYRAVGERIRSLVEGEEDEIAVMATIVAELKHSFAWFDWVGFYRVTAPGLLKVGPYQGGHGCLRITFDRGVCGQCAREKRTQVVPDVTQVPWHIACASSTRSEIVVPVLDGGGRVRAVLDIDSNRLGAFDATDQRELEELVTLLRPVFGPNSP